MQVGTRWPLKQYWYRFPNLGRHSVIHRSAAEDREMAKCHLDARVPLTDGHPSRGSHVSIGRAWTPSLAQRPTKSATYLIRACPERPSKSLVAILGMRDWCELLVLPKRISLRTSKSGRTKASYYFKYFCWNRNIKKNKNFLPVILSKRASTTIVAYI